MKTIEALRYLGLSLCVFTAACQSRTTVTLRHKTELPRQELVAFEGLMLVPVHSKEEKATSTEIVFDRVFTKEEKSRAENLLSQLKTQPTDAPPAELGLWITETDPEVLKALERDSDSPSQIDLGLSVGEGQMALMQGSRLGRKQRMCTWKMTTKEPLPSLSYELEVTVDAVDNQHMSAELQAAIVKLRESQGTRYLEAAHELRANDPSYSATVEKISLDPPNGLFIVLNSEEDYYRVLQGVASHDEFEKCADLICSGASGDFLTGFAFPQISRSLTSYELKNSMF